MSDFKLEDIIGVIFDFNGTMFFDSEKHIKAWTMYIEELTGEELTEKEINRYVKNMSGRQLIEYYLGYDISDDMYEQLSEEKENIYRRLCIADKDNLHLAPGLEKFLDYLAEYNIPRTIATTAPMSNVMFYFETFDLYRWFDTDKLVFHDKRLRDKPFPDQYLVACKMINKEPGKCMVFEDSESGIKSATAAGIKYIIGVSGDNPMLDATAYDTVKVVIKDYEELGQDFDLPT
ncbi:MAG: HAD family phosphatase [Lachnospiraceae bacterium]|nr:HAD family phosphatase [Lachnospiraceae bacterium]